jgi:VCBS repeat-containing protein
MNTASEATCFPTSFATCCTAGERRAARRLVMEALDDGRTVSVNDGYAYTVKKSRNILQILNALATTGEDVLRIRAADGTYLGVIVLVWGNDPDGDELVQDYSASLNWVEGI